MADDETISGAVTRRAFVALTSAGASAALLPDAVAAAARQDRSAPAGWSHEADIVCVGGGAAGLTAAVVAHGNGDAVIVVEKGSVPGGTTAKSGGVMWIPNNAYLAKRGIVDPKAGAMAYMVRYAYPDDYRPGHPTLGADPQGYALLSAFYDNASPMVETVCRLTGMTVLPWDFSEMARFVSPNAPRLSKSSPDYMDHGPESPLPTGRGLGPRRRDGSFGVGADLVDYLVTCLDAASRPILTRHRVTALVRNADGEVIGVTADHQGTTVRIRARKAVIFGSGGYAHNADLRRKFQPAHISGTCASPHCEGDFIAIASGSGAALGNMPGAWRGDVVLEDALANRSVPMLVFTPAGDSMIYVDKHGKRTVDEYRNYNDRAKSYFTYDPTGQEHPNLYRFMIFDQRTVDIFGGCYPVPVAAKDAAFVLSGNGVADLSRNIARRIAALQGRIGRFTLADDFAANLRASIERFNGFARSGDDEDFGRGAHPYDREAFWLSSTPPTSERMTGHDFLANHTMYPIVADGPLYAVILGLGVHDTNGGPVVNASAQIVDYADQPIAGLYGAGNCIASPSRDTYFGAGATISQAMTFGYIAANAAHREPVKAA